MADEKFSTRVQNSRGGIKPDVSSPRPHPPKPGAPKDKPWTVLEINDDCLLIQNRYGAGKIKLTLPEARQVSDELQLALHRAKLRGMMK